MRVGAMIGSADRVNLDSLFNFGFFLGAAFQIQDDVLNLVGIHERYGKEIDGAIQERGSRYTSRIAHCGCSEVVARADGIQRLHRIRQGTGPWFGGRCHSRIREGVQ